MSVRVARLSPRAAITAVFFVDGALFATWASRIPALSDHVHAGAGILGLCLLAPAAAAVVSMPLVGRLLPGRSSSVFCRVAVAGLMAAIMLPALAQTVPALAASLLVVGVANSTLDLVMNAQGVSIERGMHRPILSSLHAAFSFGGFAGAGLGALAAGLQVAPLPHFAFASALFGMPGLIATARLPRGDQDADADAPKLRWTRIPPRLALLGVACFFSLVAEGGASDWSAKLVRDNLAGTAALGAIAYAVFSIGMGTGRLLADRLWARWGADGLLRICRRIGGGNGGKRNRRLRRARRRAGRGHPDAVSRGGRSAGRLDGSGSRRRQLAWLSRLPGRAAHHRRDRAAHVAALGVWRAFLRRLGRGAARAGRRLPAGALDLVAA